MSSDGSTDVAPRRHVSTREAAFIGVGAMVGAGIFSLLGTAGEVAGSAVWLSFALAGGIAALQGYSFAKLGSRYPTAGGLLEYVNRGYGMAMSRPSSPGSSTPRTASSPRCSRVVRQLRELGVHRRRPRCGEGVCRRRSSW